MTDEQLKKNAQGLLAVRVAVVRFAGAAAGSVAEHTAAVVDELGASIQPHFVFCCLKAPPDKPWLSEAWLWLAARCWKMGKKCRQSFPDPRKGLPPESGLDVMDQVGGVAESHWSPAQANLIRSALRGEMPVRLWHMAQSWAVELSGRDFEADKGKVLVDEGGQVRTSERAQEVPPRTGVIVDGVVPKPKKRIRVKIKRRKSDG